MMERNVTYHMSEDRLERAAFIATQIGYGNVVREKFYSTADRGDYWRQITDTGVLIVRSADKRIVITLWIANVNQASDIFNGEKLPPCLYKKIVKNRQFKLAQLILNRYTSNEFDDFKATPEKRGSFLSHRSRPSGAKFPLYHTFSNLSIDILYKIFMVINPDFVHFDY